MPEFSKILIGPNTSIFGVEEVFFRMIEIVSTDPSCRWPVYGQDNVKLYFAHISIDSYIDSLCITGKEKERAV